MEHSLAVDDRAIYLVCNWQSNKLVVSESYEINWEQVHGLACNLSASLAIILFILEPSPNESFFQRIIFEKQNSQN